MTGRRTRPGEEDGRDRRGAKQAARLGMEEGPIDQGGWLKGGRERQNAWLTDVQERRQRTEKRDKETERKRDRRGHRGWRQRERRKQRLEEK